MTGRVRTGHCVAALACAAALFLAGCDKEKGVPPPSNPVVQVIEAVQRDVPVYMEWIGSVDGNVNAVIRPQVTGYLIKQNYREGDFVKQGQPLFEIDPRTFEAAVAEAKGIQVARQVAQYETTRANLAPHQAAGSRERSQPEGSRRRQRRQSCR
jgi:membrane fusion protein (multidrug efflux system)